MAEIHQLIVREGIDAARRQAASRHERGVIEAAYQVLSEDAEKMGFTYSGFALTSLPHKPPDGLVWRREGHQVTMLLESGRDHALEPMTPSDRKVVHDAVSDIDGVTTISEGEEPRRRVVLRRAAS